MLPCTGTQLGEYDNILLVDLQLRLHDRPRMRHVEPFSPANSLPSAGPAPILCWLGVARRRTSFYQNVYL